MTLRLAQVLDLMGWVRSRSHQDVVRITAERAAGLSFGDTARAVDSSAGEPAAALSLPKTSSAHFSTPATPLVRRCRQRDQGIQITGIGTVGAVVPARSSEATLKENERRYAMRLGARSGDAGHRRRESQRWRRPQEASPVAVSASPCRARGAGETSGNSRCSPGERGAARARSSR